jgi:hypothetical protein
MAPIDRDGMSDSSQANPAIPRANFCNPARGQRENSVLGFAR